MLLRGLYEFRMPFIESLIDFLVFCGLKKTLGLLLAFLEFLELLGLISEFIELFRLPDIKLSSYSSILLAF